MTAPCDCEHLTKLEWGALEIAKYWPNLSPADCVTRAANILHECKAGGKVEAVADIKELLAAVGVDVERSRAEVMAALEQQAAALNERFAALEQTDATLSTEASDLRKLLADFDVRLKALEAEPAPEPEPEPEPPPDPGTLGFEYLGSFYPPVPTDEDKASGDVMRQFAFGHGIACRGPRGIYLGGRANDGNDVTGYVAEITVPEPSRTSPPRAEYIQTLAPVVPPGVVKPDLAGLAYDATTDTLTVAIDRDYNVSGTSTPPLRRGPGTLAKHLSEGSGLLTVTDAEGVEIHSERTAVPLAITPLGLTFVNQSAKGNMRGDGPGLAVADVVDGRVTNFRQLLHYERGSGVFPDPPNKWNETCHVAGVEYIDGMYVFSGKVGLATGLPELTGKNYFYGSPGGYPIEGVNVCAGGAAKGYHAPPYESRLWFMAHENGVWRLVRTVNLSDESLMGPNDGCGQRIGSMIWLPEKRWLLLAQGGARPEIHVLAVR